MHAVAERLGFNLISLRLELFGRRRDAGKPQADHPPPADIGDHETINPLHDRKPQEPSRDRAAIEQNRDRAAIEPTRDRTAINDQFDAGRGKRLGDAIRGPTREPG